MDFFNGLFITDSSSGLRLVENVVVGPLVAMLAFVCSVGNVPLAAVLWAGGISFSGVIAFIFADLIVAADRAQSTASTTGRKLTAIGSWRCMFVDDRRRRADRRRDLRARSTWSRRQRPSIESISERDIAWNYTTVLNIVFIVVAAALFALTLRRGAKDPVCGMTVARATPHTSTYEGKTVYFCSAHCKKRFDEDPEQYIRTSQGACPRPRRRARAPRLAQDLAHSFNGRVERAAAGSLRQRQHVLDVDAHVALRLAPPPEAGHDTVDEEQPAPLPSPTRVVPWDRS